jgi:glycosyltransferase involved in cell wall biosynthesis
LRVLYFGTYERTYPRNAQVISALRRAGADVREHHVPVWEDVRHKWALGPQAALRLARAEAKLLRRPGDEFDVLVVGYPGHLDLAAARRAAGPKPIVFNPLVSLADTFVDDRGRFSRGSAAARLLERLDRWALRAADLVVADTAAGAAYLAELAGVPAERLAVCFVGAEERVFHPPSSPGDEFLFVGKLIPLHGVETIIEAARLAPEVRVTVVGSGQLDHVLGGRPDNVRWIGWLDYEELGNAYRSARCALGIFGTSAKAGRVIPNKAFQALACGTPLITADTPAARELLVDGESALLVPAGDPPALAEAMQQASSDPALLERLAGGGRAAYEESASEEVLRRRWRDVLKSVL